LRDGVRGEKERLERGETYMEAEKLGRKEKRDMVGEIERERRLDEEGEFKTLVC
jgi:hypothetical protein